MKAGATAQIIGKWKCLAANPCAAASGRTCSRRKILSRSCHPSRCPVFCKTFCSRRQTGGIAYCRPAAAAIIAAIRPATATPRFQVFGSVSAMARPWLVVVRPRRCPRPGSRRRGASPSTAYFSPCDDSTLSTTSRVWATIRKAFISNPGTIENPSDSKNWAFPPLYALSSAGSR
jgi:hypothetical protein